jgi:putative hemolysin
MTQDPPLLEIFLIIAAVALSGFFSLIETALVSARKSKLRPKAREGKKYKKALKTAEHPGPFLFILHVWISFLRIFAGVLGGFRVDRYLEGAFTFGASPLPRLLIMCAAALVITLGTVFLGELIPRQIALAAPERILAFTLPSIELLGFFLRPLIALSAKCSGLIYRLFHIEAAEPGITEDELRVALMEGEKSGIVESEERTMVEGVFYLGDRPVDAFMTHRSEIEWLDINAGRDEARRTALDRRDQRYFPVAAASLDEVVGTVSVQDILTALLEESWGGLKSIMAPPRFVPATMSALKAFEVFKKGETDFLCVMDEYGGFSGTLSIRDLIEEIVGELSRGAAGGILPQHDGTFLAGGSVNIDEAAERLSLGELPGEHQEYHTLAGFILRLAGEIPRAGAVFEWRGFSFKIISMDGNRIDQVLIRPPEKREEENGG